MKKIISLIICAVLLISALNITIFAETTTSENLLPACISTFDDPTATATHEHLTYLNTQSRPIWTDVADGVLSVYWQFADPFCTPEWHLGYYINQYALSHPAEEYNINVSLKVKGPSQASLAVREFHGYKASDDEVRIQQYVQLPSDGYKMLSGSFKLTSEKALNAHDDWYRLCLDDLVGHSWKYNYFDDITLTITPIVPLETKLPESISTFDVGGTTAHAHLKYLDSRNYYNPASPASINNGILHIDFSSWSQSYASPEWLLGSYIKNYATYNDYDNYIVNVSIDVRGRIKTAHLAIRKTDGGDQFKFTTKDVEFSQTEFKTISGSCEFTKAEALAADETSYGLCLDGVTFDPYNSVAGVDFDNIKFEILPKRIKEANLELGSSLTMDYYADLKDIDPKGVSMRFTFNDQQTTVPCPDVAEKGGDADGLYKFPFTGINPQCMADNIKAELVKGDKVIARKDEYSVRDYCVTAYEQDKSNTTLKNLLASLLVYGSAAQNYKGHNIEKLASAGLAWAENGDPFPNLEDVRNISGTPNGSKIKSAGLEFSNVIKLYFRVVNPDDVQNLTLKVTRNGNTEEPVNVLGLSLSNGYYVYYTDAIFAKGFGDKYTVQLLCNGGTVQTVTYSVNSYILRKCNETSPNGELAKALGYYGYYATQYKQQ